MNTTRPLSPRTQSVLDYIRHHFEQCQMFPTIREIQSALSLSSVSVVVYHLNKLRKLHYLTRNAHTSRTLQLTRKGWGEPILPITFSLTPTAYTTNETGEYLAIGNMSLPELAFGVRVRSSQFWTSTECQLFLNRRISATTLSVTPIVENDVLVALPPRHPSIIHPRPVYILSFPDKRLLHEQADPNARFFGISPLYSDMDPTLFVPVACVVSVYRSLGSEHEDTTKMD